MASRWLADLIGTLQSTFRIGPKTAPAVLSAASLTAARTYTFQDATGTLPLLESANTFTAAQTFQIADAGTNTVPTVAFFSHTTSATPAIGFGVGVVALLDSDTTDDQVAGWATWNWTDPTHATRTSECDIYSVYNGDAQLGIKLTAGSTPLATFPGDVFIIGNVSAANLSGTNTGDQTITLTGDVTGSGTSSFTTTIQPGVVTNAMLAGSIAPAKITAVGCSLYYDSALSAGTDLNVAHNTATAVKFKSEAFDTSSLHDTTTNISRITIPSGMGGKWLITGGVQWPAASGGVRILFLQSNGANPLKRGQDFYPAGAVDAFQEVTCIATLAAGDYVELFALQTSGGTLTLSRSNPYAPILQAVYLGA